LGGEAGEGLGLDRNGFSAGLLRALWITADGYLKPSIKLLIRLLKSDSRFRRSSTVRIE
jgi:hypothetical protein